VHGARLQRGESAVNQNLVARLKIFFHKRQVPPAAVEVAAAVVEDELEQRLAAAAPALDALGDDFAARRGCFAQSHFGDGTKMPAVFVAAWGMHQEVADGVELEPRQLGQAVEADAAEACQRRVEWMGRRRLHGKVYRRKNREWESRKRGSG